MRGPRHPVASHNATQKQQQPKVINFGFTVTAYTLAVDAGSYTLTGTDASLEYGRELNADTGSYSVTGTAASLEYGFRLTADTAAYTLSGQTASLEFGFAIDADTAAYTLTGQTASLLFGRELAPDAGAYALSGTAASLEYGFKLAADSGSYAITGTAATLTYAPVGSTYTLAADAGAYTLTGTTSLLIMGRLLAADPGTYELTGTPVTLTIGSSATATSSYNMYRGADPERGPIEIKKIGKAERKRKKKIEELGLPPIKIPKAAFAELQALERKSLAYRQARRAAMLRMIAADEDWLILS